MSSALADKKTERLVNQLQTANQQLAIAQADRNGADELMAEVRGQNEELRSELQEARELARSNAEERDVWTNERARATSTLIALSWQAAAHWLPWPPGSDSSCSWLRYDAHSERAAAPPRARWEAAVQP